MKVRRSLLKDTVNVRTRTGEGSYGDTWATAVDVPCFVDTTRKLVRDGTGQETVSELTLTLHPRTYATAGGVRTTVDPMELFSAESEVIVDGRTSRVISTKQAKLRGYVVAVEVTCG